MLARQLDRAPEVVGDRLHEGTATRTGRLGGRTEQIGHKPSIGSYRALLRGNLYFAPGEDLVDAARLAGAPPNAPGPGGYCVTKSVKYTSMTSPW